MTLLLAFARGSTELAQLIATETGSGDTLPAWYMMDCAVPISTAISATTYSDVRRTYRLRMVDQKMTKEPGSAQPRRQLSVAELRSTKLGRKDFLVTGRIPITVVLDCVRQNYNIGAIFRLCDAFLVERLVIAGTSTNLRKRKLVQAARGTQHWVPWDFEETSLAAVEKAKATGSQVIVVEQTNAAVSPRELTPAFPICLILGSEASGVSPEIIAMADAAVAIPMRGMANSINVATAAAIVLYELSSGDGARSWSLERAPGWDAQTLQRHEKGSDGPRARNKAEAN